LDKNLIEKYKNEMLKMYNKTNKNTAVPAVAQTSNSSTTGGLLAIVTTVRSLYPVKNAKVTIFTGEYPDINVVDTALTDQSGRTKLFSLPTPEKSLSLQEDNTLLPYAVYNMIIEADGYIKNIHLNIPVFSGVTSLQQSNLLLTETAGEDKGPFIFDESQKYDL